MAVQIVGTYAENVAAITAGGKLGFKLGLEKDLKTMTSAEAGVFYLTSDTRRLFIGLDNHNVAPVNQGVIAVDSLPDGSQCIPGQFYYIKSNNILAVRSGNTWVQINPDTHVASMAETVTSATNKATVQIGLTQEGGITNSVNTAGFHIVGGGSNKVTTDGKTITITDADYGVTATGNNTDGININLTKTPAGSTSAAVKESVKLKSQGGIQLAQANGVVTIDGSGINSAVTDNNIESATWSNGNPSGFTLTLTKHGGGTVGATVDPQISYGINNGSTVKFESGKAVLDVYTKDETDDKIADALMNFNALMYKGTVGGTSGTVSQLPQTGVAIGDVYIATGYGTLKLTASDTAKAYDGGTLFIATGTETDGVIANNGVTWTVVENYNTDTQAKVATYTAPIDTAFSGTAGGLSVYNKIGNATEQLGGFVVQAANGDAIQLASAKNASTNVITTTVSHKTGSYAHTNPTALPGDTGPDKYLYAGHLIQSITTDNYGHLATSTGAAVAIPTEVFTGNATENVAISNSYKTATMTHSLGLKPSNGNNVISTTTVTSTIKTESLTLTENSGALSIDLTWGTF